jgi:deoxyribose-phosphate aldolase
MEELESTEIINDKMQETLQKEQEKTEDSKVIKEYFLHEEGRSCMKDLADLFGQSEGEMSKEFGVFKAKKLYKKLSYLIVDNTLFFEEIVRRCNLAVKYGFKSVTVLPSMVKKAKFTLNKKGVEVRAIIDYPLGEETFKNRLYSVKTAIKNGVDSLIITLPTSAIKNGEYKKVLKEFKRFLRVAKKRKVSVIIDFSKLNFNEVKPIIENLIPLKKIHSVIPYNSFSSAINFTAVKDLCDLTLNKCVVEGAGEIQTATEIVTALNSGAGEILSPDCPFIAEELDGKINTLNT